MAILKLYQGHTTEQVVLLKGKQIVIGRLPDCDVVLENEDVSRRHAQITAVGNDYFIQDLESRNSTLLNNVPLRSQQKLRDGDEIKICGVVFTFQEQAAVKHVSGPTYGESKWEKGNDRATLERELKVDVASTASSETVVAVIDADSDTALLRASKNSEHKLRAVLELSRIINRRLTLDELLPAIVDSFFKIFPQSDLIAVLLVDANTGSLSVKSQKCHSDDSDNSDSPSLTIAQQAIETKEALLTRDAVNDIRFGESESVRGLDIKSAMCAPLASKSDNAIGAIQVISKSVNDPFSNADLDVLVSVGCQASLAIEHAILHDEMIESKLQEITASVSDCLWSGVVDSSGDVTYSYYSPVVETITGRPPEFYMPGPHRWLSTIHADDRPRLEEAFKRIVGSGAIDEEEEYRVIYPDQSVRWVRDSVKVRKLADGTVRLDGVVTDISERKSLEEMERGRNQVLERLAQGASLDEILTLLVESAEKLRPDLICSVLLLDKEQNCLRHGAAPNLPDFYNQAIDGLQIGLGVGSCGTAAATGKRTIVPDVMHHPHWADYREIAQKIGIAACWSEPIFSSRKEILGTFAMYYREPREPDAFDLKYIQSTAHLAGIAIEHKLAEEQLKTLNETLENRVEERTNELQQSNEDLLQFAYIVSHDLKEPLRAVTSFCKLLKADYKDKLDQRGGEFIEFAVDGANRMSLLISELLNFAQVGSRHEPLALTDFNLVVDQARQNLAVASEEANATVTVGQLPKALADETQMIQVFQNLIGNAMKFRGNEHPKIHVDAVKRDGNWLFSVADNGIGISPKQIERIFNVFQRLHTEEEYAGAGMGLAISKKIIHRHRGEMWVESDPGNGSTFYFTIPRELG